MMFVLQSAHDDWLCALCVMKISFSVLSMKSMSFRVIWCDVDDSIFTTWTYHIVIWSRKTSCYRPTIKKLLWRFVREFLSVGFSCHSAVSSLVTRQLSVECIPLPCHGTESLPSSSSHLSPDIPALRRNCHSQLHLHYSVVWRRCR